jgi:predicted kinase
MERVKNLTIVRGLPGSGKSTFAERITTITGGLMFEADKFFELDGEYKFDRTKLGDAHQWCQGLVEAAMMSKISELIVSNTSVKESELKPYIDLAEKYGYRVTSLVVENRHGNKSIHDVPVETIEKMKQSFSIKL